MLRIVILALFVSLPVKADTVLATQNIRAQSILTAGDLKVIERTISGTIANIDDAIGMEAKVTLYAGRPIRMNDIGPPAIIERNQIVTLVFESGVLTIAADARALGRAGPGDRLRVMNLMSRSTVVGTVRADGSVRVGGPDLSSLN